MKRSAFHPTPKLGASPPWLPGLPRGVGPQGEPGSAFPAVLLAALLPVTLALVAVAAEEPPYPHGNYQGDCSMCHGDQGWKPAQIGPRFDHAKATRSRFALTGAHASVPCTACHATLDFTLQKPMCSSCHEDPHRGEFGADCGRCHTARSFLDRDMMVRLHQTTRFPLAGAHAGLDCEACHQPAAQGHMQFVATIADCYGCHRADFAATTTPAHAAAGISTDCTQCHNAIAWGPARFDHSATGFPLTGAHLSVACSSCHGTPWQTRPASDCYSCHLAQYNATTSPPHAAAGIPTTCATCHSTGTWGSGSFDHSTTPFPLTGAHLSVACVTCHGTPWQMTLATDCYSCHQAQYNATADPNHAAAGFPTTCATCHNTTSWAGATFDHTWFPITSGAHSGLTCSTCHTVSTNFAAFSCLPGGCHPQATTDQNHSSVAGYTYDSNACYRCHPTGSVGG